MADKTLELLLRLRSEGGQDVRTEIVRTSEQISNGAKAIRNSTTKLGAAFDNLGVKPLQQIDREVQRLQASYDRLVRSGTVGSADLARAQTALRQRIAEARGETVKEDTAFQGLVRRAAQLLTITAGFRAIKGAVSTGLDFDRVNLALESVFGTSERAAQEFEFVRKLSNELGLNLLQTAHDYGQLAAATKGTGSEGEITRKIFTAVAKAAAALGLSADDTSGALLAVEQMASKTRVQTQELTIQLGQRLPGSVTAAARALGVTTKQLSDLVAQGKVATDDFLGPFADELDRTFGAKSAIASQLTQSSFRRLTNSLLDFANSLSKSGVNQQLGVFSDYLSGVVDKAKYISLGIRGLGAGAAYLKDRIVAFVTGDADLAASARRTLQQSALADAQLVGLGDTAAKTSAAQELATKRLALSHRIAAEESNLTQLQTKLEQAQAKQVIADKQEELRQVIETGNQAVAAKREELSKVVSLERAAASQIKTLHKDIADLDEKIARRNDTLQQEILDRRRGQLSPHDQQQALGSEIAARITRAENQLQAGQLDNVDRSAARIAELGRQLTDIEQGNAALAEAAKLADQADTARRNAKETELSQQQKLQQQYKATAATIKTQIADASDLVRQLSVDLRTVDNIDPTITVKDNIDEVLRKIYQLKDELARLGGTGAAVAVGATGKFRAGGLVRRLASGGQLPGYGGGDRRLVMAEDGEFVLRKEAVRRYGVDFVSALNQMRIGGFRYGGLVPRMPDVPRLAKGGAISGAPAGSGGTVRLELAFAGQDFQVFGERNEVQRLVKAMTEVSRGA